MKQASPFVYTHLEEVRHEHRQHDSFFQQPLGLGEVGDVVPPHVGVFLHDVAFEEVDLVEKVDPIMAKRESLEKVPIITMTCLICSPRKDLD